MNGNQKNTNNAQRPQVNATQHSSPLNQGSSQQRTVHRTSSQNTRPPEGIVNRSKLSQDQVQRQPQPRRNQPKPRSDLKDNLRSQTPLNRQLRKQTAPSEPGTVRRTSTPQYFKVRQNGEKAPKVKRQKTNRSFTKRVILLGVIGYAILLPLCILVASLMLKANISSEADNFRYQLGEGKNTVSRKTYSFERIYRNGVYYIDMDSLADYCELTTTGDGKNMRYVVRETAESVEFVIGESVAYINGVSERTGGNAFVYDGKVHIPLEFAKRCFLNLDITLDTKNNTITIVRQKDDSGNMLSLDFPYKLPFVTDKINFGALDVEIQEQIIKQNQPDLP